MRTSCSPSAAVMLTWRASPRLCGKRISTSASGGQGWTCWDVRGTRPSGSGAERQTFLVGGCGGDGVGVSVMLYQSLGGWSLVLAALTLAVFCGAGRLLFFCRGVALDWERAVEWTLLSDRLSPLFEALNVSTTLSAWLDASRWRGNTAEQHCAVSSSSNSNAHVTRRSALQFGFQI